MNPSPLNLSPNQVDLWLVYPEEIKDPFLLERYHALMNPTEKEKQARFHFERHRHQYLLTRATIRSLLSRYMPEVSPAGWAFEENKYGRPHIAPQLNSKNIHFNLSHTESLIVCGVVRELEIGVDVENIERGGDLINIADRFFSPSEVQDLHQLSSNLHTDRFFDYWTLKESYIKARGMGLSIPLEQFSFHIGEGHKIDISIDAKQNDPPERWQFRQWRAGSEYKIAMTLERRPGVHFDVNLRKLVPFTSQTGTICTDLRNGFDRP